MCPNRFQQAPDIQSQEPDPEAYSADRITVQVDDSYAAEVSTVDFVRAVEATLMAEGHPDSEVSVVVTSDEVLADLNLQFRGVAGPTDVLSFAAQEPAPGFVSAPEAANYLGDVLIALPFTRRQAAEMGRDLADELILLAVHGTLHLLGYDHAEPDEEIRMWARQDEILIGLK